MTDVRIKTRNERLLSLISSGGLDVSTLERILDCPYASIRRSIQELRAEGYYIVLDCGRAQSYGKRSALIACEEPYDDTHFV